MLLGDAAGMPNPMTAGGLRTAFESGMKAAEAILKNDPEKYERWWKKSKTADRRFMKAHAALSSMTRESGCFAPRLHQRPGSVRSMASFAALPPPSRAAAASRACWMRVRP